MAVYFAFGLAWTGLAISPAEADESPAAGTGRVGLEIRSCPAVPVESVRRILSIEIGDLLLDDTQPVPEGADRLTIRCADDLAWVEAAGQGGRVPIERRVRLDGLPGDLAPRALALVGLELLAARSATVRERILSRQQVMPSTVAATAAPAQASPAAATREAVIGLAGIWRAFLVPSGLSAWGGRVQANSTVGRVANLAGDAEVAGGRNQIDSMGEATALLLSCGGTIGLRGERSNLGASIGVGGRMGVVRLSGSSMDPIKITGATVWHPWGGPMMSASVSGALGRVALTLGAESGWSLSFADGLASGVTVISLRGPWVAFSLGGGFRP
jgi:hypothetical protein